MPVAQLFMSSHKQYDISQRNTNLVTIRNPNFRRIETEKVRSRKRIGVYMMLSSSHEMLALLGFYFMLDTLFGPPSRLASSFGQSTRASTGKDVMSRVEI